MECQASYCNWGHFRHAADVMVETRFGTFPVCNGTLDEWCARFPEVIVRVDPIDIT